MYVTAWANGPGNTRSLTPTRKYQHDGVLNVLIPLLLTSIEPNMLLTVFTHKSILFAHVRTHPLSINLGNPQPKYVLVRPPDPPSSEAKDLRIPPPCGP